MVERGDEVIGEERSKVGGHGKGARRKGIWVMRDRGLGKGEGCWCAGLEEV